MIVIKQSYKQNKMIILSKKELVKKLKKINQERLNNIKDKQNGNIEEIDFQIKNHYLSDNLSNWEKYYKLA